MEAAGVEPASEKARREKNYVRFRFGGCRLPVLEPASSGKLSPIVVSLLLRTEALGPILEDDARWMPSRPSTRGGYLKIRQRMQTAYWQFCVSDRLTGARNPARLSTTIQSRRIRCAPFLLSLYQQCPV